MMKKKISKSKKNNATRRQGRINLYRRSVYNDINDFTEFS